MAKSPPTRRVLDVLTALSDSPEGLSATELARRCDITTSTCALVMSELEEARWVTRRDDRRYSLGTGLFAVVQGLRARYPLLDRGREALTYLHDTLAAGCSMSKIGSTHLTTVDSVGHGTDGEHAAGQRFPIDPPFGLVAMAWRDRASIDAWLGNVTPPLGADDIDEHRKILADIRRRGYGAWRFNQAHSTLHDRLTAALASADSTPAVTRRLSTLMTIVTLQSVTPTVETDLRSIEFVVLPIFGPDGQPEYQIEIHLGRSDRLTMQNLERALDTTRHLLQSHRSDQS